MARVDDTDIAQPYVGTPDEVYDNLFPNRTTTQLEDISDGINTENKRTGKMVYNSTTGIPVWADGPAAGDTWSGADGAVDHTPS